MILNIGVKALILSQGMGASQCQPINPGCCRCWHTREQHSRAEFALTSGCSTPCNSSSHAELSILWAAFSNSTFLMCFVGNQAVSSAGCTHQFIFYLEFSSPWKGICSVHLCNTHCHNYLNDFPAVSQSLILIKSCLAQDCTKPCGCSLDLLLFQVKACILVF